MDMIHNIFSAHSRLSPAAKQAASISRHLFRDKQLSTTDINTLIAIDSDCIAPFRTVLARDGNRHGSARREAIVDAIIQSDATQHHPSTIIALLASFVDDQEGMVGAKAITHLVTFGPRVDGILCKALTVGNRWTRSYAVRALGDFGGIRAVPQLIKALQDEDERVRSDAAEALGKVGDSQATQPLFGALADPNWLVRESASSALATFSDQEIIDKLTRFLADDDHRIRAQAVRTLGNMNNGDTLKPLLAALNDPYFEVAWDAITALATPDNHEALPALLARYHQGDDALRQRITTAGNTIGIHHVATQLHHSDTTVRIPAAEIIGQQQDFTLLTPLISAWQQESDHTVQMWLIIAIGQLATAAGAGAPDNAILTLQEATSSPHHPVRYHATKTLESLPHPLAEQFVRQSLQSTTVSIACPNCLHQLHLLPPLTGKRRQCPQCKLGFTIRQGRGEKLEVIPTISHPAPTAADPSSAPWHAVLQVKKDADAATIRQAFRALLKQYHPDKVATLGAEFQQLAEEKTRQLTRALREGLAEAQQRS